MSLFLRPGEIINKLKEKKYIFNSMVGADFGCGSGYFTAILSKEVGVDGKIYAIDVDEQVLKEAQEFIASLKISNVKFLHQDLEVNSGLDSNSLDFVFISQVLYQSEKPEKIIEEARRVLKNDGFLIILEPQKNNILFKKYNIYDPQFVFNILQKHNFKIIEIDQSENYYLIIGQKNE